MKEKERTLTKIETSAIVFNTSLQHFSRIKIQHPPYSQNLIPSLFAVSVHCKPSFPNLSPIFFPTKHFPLIALKPTDEKNSFCLLPLFIAFYWAWFTVAQRAQEDFNVPYILEGAPPHPPPICIRKTATAPGSPYSFRIVRGFFYVPQNYQHSRNCETGYRPYPRRLESLTICRWNYKGSTFSSVI